MKLLLPRRGDQAMTLIEVILVIVVIFILAAVLLPGGTSMMKARRVMCITHLKEMGLAVKIWAGDNNDHYPQFVSITNGGAREQIISGNAAAYFQVISNQLSTPYILACVPDAAHGPAANFSDLKNTNISYFVGIDATAEHPKSILFGDDNFEIAQSPVKAGVQNLWTNQSLRWTNQRHGDANNIAFADGSVFQINNSKLANVLAQPDDATNLIAIP